MCLGGAFTLLVIGLLRTWRPQRHDIAASEIHPDLEAGEELLRDALGERLAPDSAPAQDKNFNHQSPR